MSFAINIGYTKSPKNELEKKIVWKYKLNGVLKEECDIDNPVISLRIGDNVGIKVPDITLCNYMYIPNFNRYYFIEKFKTIRNIFLEVSGDIDPLQSFKDDIYENDGMVIRTASKEDADYYIDDGFMTIESDDNTFQQNFSGGQNHFTKAHSNYILILAGESPAVETGVTA